MQVFVFLRLWGFPDSRMNMEFEFDKKQKEDIRTRIDKCLKNQMELKQISREIFNMVDKTRIEILVIRVVGRLRKQLKSDLLTKCSLYHNFVEFVVNYCVSVR